MNCKMNCSNCSNCQGSKPRSKSGILKEMCETFGLPVVVIAIDEQDSNIPMSKQEWDAIRIQQLGEYFVKCVSESIEIPQELIQEYNQLIAKN